MCEYFCIGFIDFMLAGKTLTKFTNLFSPNNFKKKWWYISKIFYDKYLKMTECNCIDHSFHETTNMYPSDQQHFRLNFVADIKERELMNKRLSKYIASFDYFDKSWIVLSITTGSISIASFATVIEAPLGIVSASFGLAFLVSTGIIKSCEKQQGNCYAS